MNIDVTKTTGTDADFMRRALQLAERGCGAVEPNPMVGCVIVKNGRVVGEGWHRRFGGPHAEIEALKRCRVSPRGVVVYVTLEPCCHVGKTPPCTRALLDAGVQRVVAAMLDPNKPVSGRGLRQLRSAGLEVECGLMRDQAAELNAPYLKLLKQRRPWVVLKWAQSLDGKIATHTSDSKWISDEKCRSHAHKVRGMMDAVVVGRGTVMKDDPMLTARRGRVRRIAARIVLDARLRTSPNVRLVQTAGETPTWFVCTKHAPRSRRRSLENAGCSVHQLASEGGRPSLSAFLDLLGEHQMTNVLVEGGGELLGAFFDRRLADEVHVYLAPLLIGGAGAVSALGGRGAATISQAPRLPDAAQIKRLGAGWFIQTRLAR